MIKTIYHGSNKIIEKPLFGFGKTYNDYGLGFYCTEVLDMAKEWGVSKDNDGFANIYEIAIQYKGYEVAESAQCFSKKELRDKTARRQYFDVEKNRRQRGDLYIVQILDEEIKADDPRLR